MIKPNELRIGNALEYFVEDSLSESEWILNIVDADDIALACKDKYFNKYYRPIPLTPEILEKCGFVGKKQWFYKERFLLGFISTDDNLQAEWKFGGTDGGWNLINIKHLHQLQNLYFALTGEELTFKP